MYSLVNLFGVARSWDPDMPFQQVQLLLLVAMFPGITQSELAERLDLSQSSISRNVNALGKIHRLKKEGLDFIEAIPDPKDRRRQIVFLTGKGRTAAEELCKIIWPGFSLPHSPTAIEHMNNARSQLRKRR